MVICVVGDVHGNMPALEAVLEQAGESDGFWCVGDTVGYGPFPDECIQTVRRIFTPVVTGNHDLGSIGRISLKSFNADARAACLWTTGVIEEESKRFLEGLPLRQETHGVLLVHGSPRDPVWEYVLSMREAAPNLEEMPTPICFHGHSHVPGVFALKEGEYIGSESPEDGTVIDMQDGGRFLINVGSVGQSRDGDPRACYVEYNPDERIAVFHRVGYPIERAQRKMEEVGLPGFLIRRLALGR